MIVQWCIKGLHLPGGEAEAESIIQSRGGLICNWWREVKTISPQQTREKLLPASLNLHVNHFDDPDPVTGEPFSQQSPFISLSCGTVERDVAAQTNLVHRARRTALWFGTNFGKQEAAYLFTCWVILAPRSCVAIEGVAEEVRDLNTYRRYSPFQTEGEVAAKIIVPDNQIRDVEKWELNETELYFQPTWRYDNPRFTEPEQLTNVRELI